MHTSQEGPGHLKPANSLGVSGRSSKNATMSPWLMMWLQGASKVLRGRGGHQEEERDQMLPRTQNSWLQGPFESPRQPFTGQFSHPRLDLGSE